MAAEPVSFLQSIGEETFDLIRPYFIARTGLTVSAVLRACTQGSHSARAVQYYGGTAALLLCSAPQDFFTAPLHTFHFSQNENNIVYHISP